MPIIRVTLIEGYDEAVRDRLLEGYTAVTRTVLDAVPDGITAVVEEVKASNYRRGNQRKSSKTPPLPPDEVVRAYLHAMERRDLTSAKALLAPDFAMTFPGGARFTRLEELVEWAKPRYRHVAKEYERFDTVHGLEHAAVYCFGTLFGEWLDGSKFSGIRFIDRFTVRGGLLLDQMVWNDLALARA
jgi:phenylpyruvate tautomerase PptA (4-oxalocrotonate tautomerase family)